MYYTKEREGIWTRKIPTQKALNWKFTFHLVIAVILFSSSGYHVIESEIN